MSGGGEEYVMGNMSSSTGNYTYSNYGGGSNYTYAGNEKYLDFLIDKLSQTSKGDAWRSACDTRFRQ